MSTQTSIRSWIAALALAAHATHAQGSSSSQIPPCLVECRPWIVELTTFDCETVCMKEEFELDLALATGSGDPYVPRFAQPGCPPLGACPPGAETFQYVGDDLVLLSAGLWSTAADDWLPAFGAVGAVRFFAAPVVSTLGADDMADLPWIELSPPVPVPGAFVWQTTWPTAEFDDPAGYVLQVEMTDAALGEINAFSLAMELFGCGWHPYGEDLGGANRLDLYAVGGDCPGSAAGLWTAGTTADVVFYALALDGAFQPFEGGALLVDLDQAFLVTCVDAHLGQAELVAFLPPNPALIGLQAFVQSLALEQEGTALSNGLRLTVCPCP